MSSKPATTAKAKPVSNEEFVSNEPVVDNTLEIARAIGEGIAKSLNPQPKDYSNAAIAAIEIESRANEIGRKQAEFARTIAQDTDNYVSVSIPLLYKQYVPSMTVSINGCTIKLEAGKQYRVHKLYAVEIEKRLRHIDKKVDKMRQGEQGADIQFIERI